MAIDERFHVCPFCGKDVHLVTHYDKYGNKYDVCCYTDGCYLEFGADWQLDTVEELLTMWNRRDYHENRS